VQYVRVLTEALLFQRLLKLHVYNSEVPDHQHYRTTHTLF